MNKKEFIKYIAEKNEITQKESERMLNVILEAMHDAFVDGNDLKFIGFGNFEISSRAEREGRNPATGATILIPETKVLKFKPSKTLKEEINA